MDRRTRIARLVLSNSLLLVACLIFASGFFPYKPFLPGLAAYGNLIDERDAAPAQFDKVIFMVVDALRSDFVFSHDSGFSFTQSLIRNGTALPFTSHAAAPTVTMPRVKAITTGSIPSFLDMILNFAESDKSSSLATQDTWLAQMKKKPNGKLVMYGDDTWLKLFPNFFARADGTSSFFVSDFSEVDNNVTRHLPDELQNPDWNAMVLHYLGMDHIGHKGGPRSVNMLPKQREMDSIVKQIYEAISTNEHLSSTLFVMCGDHGMNDNGNHGGSAPGETSPALVWMSPKFSSIATGVACPTDAIRDFEYYSVVEQSDIASTLAGLLGFPTPLNNLGIFIPQLLHMWKKVEHREQVMLVNALQILNIARKTYPHRIYDDPDITMDCSKSLSDSDSIACAWKDVGDRLVNGGGTKSDSLKLMSSLAHFCKTAQSLLSSAASNYDTTMLHYGVSVSLIAVLLSFIAALPALQLPNSISGLAFVAGTVLYAVMMFASSYVEEEQHFWYWMASAWMTIQLLRSPPKALASSNLLNFLILLRLMRRWNQSGQKYQGAPDISKLLHRFPLLVWPLILWTFQTLATEIASRTFEPAGRSPSTARFGAALLAITTISLKIAHAFQHERWLLAGAEWAVGWLDGFSSVTLARLVFYWLFIGAAYVVAGKLTGRQRHAAARSADDARTLAQMLHPLLTVLLLAQTTPTNIPAFLIFLHQLRSLRRLRLSIPAITLTTLAMAHASFFALGGTNAISSLDLSSAYNGISSYNPAPVGALLFIGNWAGPIFWGSAGVALVMERAAAAATPTESDADADADDARAKATRRRTAVIAAFLTHAELLTLFTAAAVCAVLAACTVLRTHLFVWTVFSPKFLYAAAWAAMWHGVCNLAVGGLLAYVQ